MTPRCRHFPANRPVSPLALLLAGILCSASAGHRIPPELGNASEAKKRKYIELQSQIDLREKIRAGQQRYQIRQAARRSMIEEMRSRCEERKEAVDSEGKVPETSASEQERGEPSWLLLSALLLIPIGAPLLRHWRAQQAEEIDLEPYVPQESPACPSAAESAEKARHEALQRIESVRLCLDIGQEAKALVPEENIRQHLESILQNSQIRIEEGSNVVLKLTVNCEWDERRLILVHEENLSVMETLALCADNQDRQPPGTKLWGAGSADFTDESKAVAGILCSVEQITSLFLDVLGKPRQLTSTT